MRQVRAIAAVVGVVGALVAVGFCLVAVYEHYEPRDFRSWDETGPSPIASALYYAHGDRVTEIMLTTTLGTKLADIADMSVFGPAKPGASDAEFARLNGASVIHTGRVAVEAFREVDRSGLVGEIERWVLHAWPERERLPVVGFFHPVIAEKIAKAKISGTVHVHNGSSTGFLTCRVYEGRIVTDLRWHGAA